MNIIIVIKEDFDLEEAETLLQKEGVYNTKILKHIKVITGTIDITYYYLSSIKSLDFVENVGIEQNNISIN